MINSYVQGMLERIPHLASEWEIARDQHNKASVEERYTQAQFDVCEKERLLLQATMDFWIDNPNTEFEQKEILRSAKAAIRAIGRRNA